jgi:translocation and assembly module TamA
VRGTHRFRSRFPRRCGHNPPGLSHGPRPGRRPRAAPLCAALLLAATACSIIPGLRFPDGTPERPRITSFEIVGTHVVSASELKDHLATQESYRKKLIVLPLWPEPQYFDPDALANDKRRIARYYQARGYYHARVESADVIPDGPGRVKIRIRVFEGSPVHVTQVEIPGIEGAPEARARLGKLPIRPGDVFTEAAYDAARAAIQLALTSTGWAKAEVSEHAEIDPALDEAHVRYTVTPGERYRFDGVFVAGAVAIPRARIREEAEQVVKAGTIFDSTELPKAQNRVFDLGVFGGVRVSQGAEDPNQHTIGVIVSVREAPFRTVRAGPGFTFQQTRYEADLVAGWAHRNWQGGLRKLNLDARAGYAWLPTIFNVQKRGAVGLASADFTQPGMITRYVDLNLRAELERGLEQAYDFYAERFRVGLPFKLGRLLTFVPSLNLELYELGGQVGKADPNTGSVLLLRTCPGRNPNLCLLSYLEQRIAIDLRNDPINTTHGLYLAVSVQEGFSFQGNGSSYLRLLPEARAFASFPAGVVLAGRARIGFVQSLTKSPDLPIPALFTSGGPNLMRGYYTRQLSPVLPTCPNNAAVCDQKIYIPVGGAGLVDGSVELRFPISGSLGGSVFLDFGDVRLSASDSLDPANLQYAAGAGIRYKTIFGPLRLDVASRLPTARGADPWPGVQVVQLDPVTGKVSSILAGVHHDPIVSVHLSIGEAF